MILTQIAFKIFPSLRRFVKTVNSYGRAIKALTAQVDDLQHQLKHYAVRLEMETAPNYHNQFTPQTRYISKIELNSLAKEWLPRFNHTADTIDNSALGYMAQRICDVESMCIGRIAGYLPQLLVRGLAARSVTFENLDVLEIGTLFGVGIGAIYDTSQGFFNNIHFTVIDIFDGYYGQPLDVHTRIPVKRTTFEYNLCRLAIPGTDYTIIHGRSSDREVVNKAAARQYNLLIIDGDHSYEGVKQDYQLYKPMVVRNGYIIFDDYWSNFPGIVRFIDDEVTKYPDVMIVGKADRVAVFKVL